MGGASWGCLGYFLEGCLEQDGRGQTLETCPLLGGTEVGRSEAVWPLGHWGEADTKSGLKNVQSVGFMFAELALCSRPCTGPFVSPAGYFYPRIFIPPWAVDIFILTCARHFLCSGNGPKGGGSVLQWARVELWGQKLGSHSSPTSCGIVDQLLNPSMPKFLIGITYLSVRILLAASKSTRQLQQSGSSLSHMMAGGSPASSVSWGCPSISALPARGNFILRPEGAWLQHPTQMGQGPGEGAGPSLPGARTRALEDPAVFPPCLIG